MTNQSCILAIDQGTSSTKAVLLGLDLDVLGVTSVAVDLDAPQAGWVQQDPEQIWKSVLEAASRLAIDGTSNILGVAITNQRESALAWDAQSGQPLSPMLGWQDRRTSARATQISAEHGKEIRQITGLPVDPMFSALKFEWILDQIDPDRSRSSAGQIMLGTVDSWLVYKLTGRHVIEVGNASRTQLLEVETGTWSKPLLELFGIPAAALPSVVASDFQALITHDGPLRGLQILGVMADSHAALFAHHALDSASVKATYGTGSSIMALGGGGQNSAGLVKTIAWATGFANSQLKLRLALEGNILSSGSTLVWLGNLLSKSTDELAQLAIDAGDSDVNLVPAFGGLGAPWWDTNAQALVTNMTLDTGAAQLAKAAFESIALQIEDVLLAVEAAIDAKIHAVNVDGGPTANHWLMQLQADLSQRTVVKNPISELSAVGVAIFAAQSAGFMPSELEVASQKFVPKMQALQVKERGESWHLAVSKSRSQQQINARKQ